ncbi:DUF4214 domain-containing protein [Pseudomonas sp. TR47]|uniref:DUF4214 domain-containing protein n=1 Tax=Pseudomonas sp. TR47 TaxID=3342639 RepID=UPI00376F4AA4
MAASNYLDQIQQLYVAYFGRPADPEGLNFWSEQVDREGGSLNSVISGFSASTESQALHGNFTTAQVIQAIYANLFSREPDPDGLAFWQEQIDGGAVPQAQAALAIMSSAQAIDGVALSNKLAVANAFTAQIDTPAEIAGYSGADSASIARAYLAKVDATDASVTIANATLSSNVAAATGTGTSTPLPPVVPAQPFVATLDSVSHAVSFSGTATGDITVTWSGTVGDSEATFSRGGFSAEPITFGGVAANSITLADNQTLVGSANTLVGLTVNGTGAVHLTDNAVFLDATTFSANTANDVLTVTGDAFSGLPTDLTNLTGFETINLVDSTLPLFNNFTIANGAGTTINADISVNVTLGAGGQVFNGSSGDDIVRGGSGNDTIAADAGLNQLQGGGGDDTFNIAGGSSNIISDLNTGDVLVVESSGSVTANGVWNFTATAQTVNNGAVFINTLVTSSINLSQAQGENGFTVSGNMMNDTITGSAMSDTFIMTGISSGTNGWDTFHGFTSGLDKIQFSLATVNAATASSLVVGSLDAANFVSGPGAIADSGSSYFIYDTGTGTLSCDADGYGAGAAVELLTLTGVPPLQASDIILAV